MFKPHLANFDAGQQVNFCGIEKVAGGRTRFSCQSIAYSTDALADIAGELSTICVDFWFEEEIVDHSH